MKKQDASLAAIQQQEQDRQDDLRAGRIRISVDSVSEHDETSPTLSAIQRYMLEVQEAGRQRIL